MTQPEINRERLATVFTTLCETDSPSKNEGKIAALLKKIFTELGADEIYEDNSAGYTGSQSGNLIIRFNATNSSSDGFFLSCHMDTVEPGTGVEVVRNGNIFTSRGDTILGGDDKSGIAAIIELFTLIKENNIPHPLIEVIITTCEEIGLLGAKYLEIDRLQTKYGYALDSSGIDYVIVNAPAATKIKVTITGKAAHAGICPEAGINALSLAATALSKLELGRIDYETTANFGQISGGTAANIIPEQIVLHGEVRSHNQEKLDQYTQKIADTFRQTIDAWKPGPLNSENAPELTLEIENDYPLLSLKEGSPVLNRVKNGAEIVGKELKYIAAGGGSDANIFNHNGFDTAIVATGMTKVHTLQEQLDLNDLVSITELLYGITVADSEAK